VREGRHPADRVTGEALRLIRGRAAHRIGADDISQALLTHAPVAAAQHDDRPITREKDERLDDPAHFDTDLARRIVGRTRAGGKPLDLDLDAALGRESSHARDVDVLDRGHVASVARNASPFPVVGVGITRATMTGMRGRGVLLPVGVSILVAAVILIVLTLSGRSDALAVQSVGDASEVGATPLSGTVRAADGADRLLQRERTGYPCGGAQTMGCPPSTPVRMVPLFLVRDLAGTIHAFIGKDPRNGCALEWLPEVQDGVFHDVCHGALYDRQGRVVGGPSPWNLNQWTVEVRDNTVFVDTSKIITGPLRLR
jgi:nitrite reductase/ring-hydroxylating ferredoxin subunit